MKKVAKRLFVIVVLAALALAGGAVFNLLQHGISARDEPTAIEAFLARRLRHLAVPWSERKAKNPVPATPEALSRARAHFADHCASCHANDGRGKTTIGQNLYPKAPDMWLEDTQGLSDGEIFSIIKNGVRLTGMPAWGDSGHEDDAETWELVHFIRHLPELTAEELEEMVRFNPVSRAELDEERAIEDFLAGGEPPPATNSQEKNPEHRHEH